MLNVLVMCDEKHENVSFTIGICRFGKKIFTAKIHRMATFVGLTMNLMIFDVERADDV